MVADHPGIRMASNHEAPVTDLFHEVMVRMEGPPKPVEFHLAPLFCDETAWAVEQYLAKACKLRFSTN